MKAIVIREFGEPESLRVEDVPTPEPEAGEVTIDVAYAGVGLIDSLIATGRVPFPLPRIPGLEVSGTIRAVGQGVTALVPGQRVVALLVDLSGGKGMAGYAEVAVAKAALTVPLRADDDLAAAAGLVVNGATAFLATEGLKPGAKVAISGASGGLGQALIIAAKTDGASEIIAVARNMSRYQALRELGATEVVPPDAFAASNVDAAFDTAGGEIRVRMLGALAQGGQLSILGNASGIDLPLSGDTIWFQSLRVSSVSVGNLGHVAPDRIIRATHATLDAARGKAIGAEIVDLTQAGEAHRALLNGEGPGKFVLRVNG